MTVYLCTERFTVTGKDGRIQGEDFTFTYCSPRCRSINGTSPSHNKREDDHYEFDETCNNCHATIPAADAPQERG